MKSDTLFAFRDRFGYSQAKMAAALGIGRRTYGQYERGESEIPSTLALACAALAFGLPPME
jgi:transcriptional regulator with XRE-family HTH domain